MVSAASAMCFGIQKSISCNVRKGVSLATRSTDVVAVSGPDLDLGVRALETKHIKYIYIYTQCIFCLLLCKKCIVVFKMVGSEGKPISVVSAPHPFSHGQEQVI